MRDSIGWWMQQVLRVMMLCCCDAWQSLQSQCEAQAQVPDADNLHKWHWQVAGATLQPCHSLQSRQQTPEECLYCVIMRDTSHQVP